MTSFALLLHCSIAALVNAQYQITDAVGLGRRFDGIGGLSGGGATSKLLMAYNEPHRSEILDLLFKPFYGASLQILKVEIGGDGLSVGSESSHMHEANEENYNRGYEWWLMKEAKKRNPSIKLFGLPWAFPGWVGDYGDDPYKNVTKTAWYIVKWIKGARDVHNLTIDFIGIWNERGWNGDYIVELRSVLNMNGFRSVKIVAPDKFLFSADDYTNLTRNPNVFNAIFAIGTHYPGRVPLAENTRTGPLAVWSSEDYSTYNDNFGAACWARTLNQNYVYGNMTRKLARVAFSTIAWNLISAYYSGLPYERNGLMDAMQPWSGHYTIRNPIWMTAHTTHFTSFGWSYLKHGFGSGILSSIGGGSYVSLTNGQDLTIVIETMVMNSAFTLFLDIDAIYTLSTIYSPGSSRPGSIPARAPFPLPYTEDFNGYNVDEEPKYLAQQNGAWEIVKAANESFVRQKTINRPVEWCGNPSPATFAIIGDNACAFRPPVSAHYFRSLDILEHFNFRQAQDIAMSISVRSPAVSGSRSLVIALRTIGLNCLGIEPTALFLWLKLNTTEYWISYDAGSKNISQSGNLSAPIDFDTWHKLSMSVTGNALNAIVNADRIDVQLADNATTGGFVGIGSGDYGYSDWDDLIISSATQSSTTLPFNTSTTSTTATTSTSTTTSTAISFMRIDKKLNYQLIFVLVAYIFTSYVLDAENSHFKL